MVATAQRGDSGKLVPVDTLVKRATPLRDAAKVDSIRRAFTPRKATIRSAILPGWGQVYVRRNMNSSFIGKYWKLPIIYGALGITAGVFSYNIKGYRELRYAYSTAFRATQRGATQADTLALGTIAQRWQAFANSPGDLRRFRDEFRQNIDYSVLVFLLFWGLNVVDATVDAHLKAFDVSPDLSLKFKLGPSQMAGTTGVSLVLALK